MLGKENSKNLDGGTSLRHLSNCKVFKKATLKSFLGLAENFSVIAFITVVFLGMRSGFIVTITNLDLDSRILSVMRKTIE
jgi:hypothetical protein